MTGVSKYHGCIHAVKDAPRWRERLAAAKPHEDPQAAAFYYDLLAPLASEAPELVVAILFAPLLHADAAEAQADAAAQARTGGVDAARLGISGQQSQSLSGNAASREVAQHALERRPDSVERIRRAADREKQQRQAEAGRFMLLVGAVAGHIADLAQRILEAAPLRDLGELAVVIEAPGVRHAVHERFHFLVHGMEPPHAVDLVTGQTATADEFFHLAPVASADRDPHIADTSFRIFLSSLFPLLDRKSTRLNSSH